MPVLTDSYVAGNMYTAAEVTAVAQAINGSGYLAPVLCATVGTETFTIAAGSVTVISGTTLDGQSPGVGERVLIKDAPSASGTGSAMSNQFGNGVYSVINATTNLTVARVFEMGGGDIAYNPSGWVVAVAAGTVNGGQQFSTISPSDPNAAMVYGTGGNTIQWQLQPNLTNTATFSGKTFTGYTETVDTSMGTISTGTTVIPALSLGTLKTVTLPTTGAVTFTMPTATTGQSFVLLVQQGASPGTATATFTGVVWPAATAPVITATISHFDVITFFCFGSSIWHGTFTQNFAT